MRIYRTILFSALAAVVSSLIAGAEPVTWTLNGVTSIGTSITGSFVFDEDTTTYSDIDIFTSGGTVIPGRSWSQIASFGEFSGGIVLVSPSSETGADSLELDFVSELTDAGGSIAVLDTNQGICADPTCVSFFPYSNDPGGGIDFNVTGTVVAAPPVPEPGTFALFGSGLLSIAWVRRRQIWLRH